ncbi:MAG: hypothetical protein JJU45_01000 [Acidimicrobiia bacterium]|nr:hypothetical protein [Acidimicrobiia bacterium]
MRRRPVGTWRPTRVVGVLVATIALLAASCESDPDATIGWPFDVVSTGEGWVTVTWFTSADLDGLNLEVGIAVDGQVAAVAPAEQGTVTVDGLTPGATHHVRMVARVAGEPWVWTENGPWHEVVVPDGEVVLDLGAGRNYLGTGNLPFVTTDQQLRGMPGVPTWAAEQAWLSINGPCSSREQGDWLLPVSVGNFTTANPPPSWGSPGWTSPEWRGCTDATDPEITMVDSHDADGYLLSLQVPETFSGDSFTVQVFDAARCGNASSDPVPPNQAGIDIGALGDPFWTRFRVRGPAGSGAPAASPVLAGRTFETAQHCADVGTGNGFQCGDHSWSMRWCDLHTVVDPEPGATYHLQVDTGPVPDGVSSAQHFVNSYGVRVRTGEQFEPCSGDPTDPAVPHSPDCVVVAGAEWLSVHAYFTAALSSFDLTQVDRQWGGATLEAWLYDIAEGTVGLQLLDPLGDPVGFEWEVIDETGGDVAPTGGWQGSVAPGDLLDSRGLTVGNPCGGGNPQPGPGRISSAKFNDRMLVLRTELPDDLVAAYGGASTWRVAYHTCPDSWSLPSDRTTWGAVLVPPSQPPGGSPVMPLVDVPGDPLVVGNAN